MDAWEGCLAVCGRSTSEGDVDYDVAKAASGGRSAAARRRRAGRGGFEVPDQVRDCVGVGWVKPTGVRCVGFTHSTFANTLVSVSNCRNHS